MVSGKCIANEGSNCGAGRLFLMKKCVMEGDLGDWVDVGKCYHNPMQGGEGTQLQLRDCYITSSCPALIPLENECAADNLLTCSGFVQSVPCSRDGGVGKRSGSAGRGDLIMIGNYCVLPLTKTCGTGTILMAYECYLTNSCPLDDYSPLDGCTAGPVECSRVIHQLPCSVPCPDQENEVRSCFMTKTCSSEIMQYSKVDCQDAWACSEFYRFDPVTSPTTVPPGRAARCYVMVTSPSVPCYLPPSVARYPVSLGSSLKSANLVMESVDLGILLESIRTLTSSDFSEASHMLKYDNGGTHTAYFRSDKFLVRECYGEEGCCEGEGCYRQEECDKECDTSHLGTLTNYGGCLVPNEENCGDGEMIQVFSCFFDESCPVEFTSCYDNFLTCPQLFHMVPCSVLCEGVQETREVEWVANGQCHQTSPDCTTGEEGTQLMMNSCVEDGTCDSFPASGSCDNFPFCTNLFHFEPCQLTCEVQTAGEWVNLYDCIPDEGDCGLGTQPQARECVHRGNCPSSIHMDCIDPFSCSDVYRQQTCIILCPGNDLEGSYYECVLLKLNFEFYRQAAARGQVNEFASAKLFRSDLWFLIR
eukprot:sb/3463287/